MTAAYPTAMATTMNDNRADDGDANGPPRVPQRELLALWHVRVGDVFVRKPLVVDGALNLVEVCEAMTRQGTSCVLVRDGARTGIFTTTDLRDALPHARAPRALAVRECARFELVGVAADAPVHEALLAMLQHRVHRVVVRGADGEIVGVLGQLDLLAALSNHSYLIAQQIADARDIAAVAQATRQVDALVALLHRDGVRVDIVARLVRELSRQAFAKLWTLIAPQELIANSCLVAMGSEGRGEQILKTDQDNALLLRDGYAPPADLAAIADRFTAALIECGYPPCPGGVMLSRTPWRAPLAAFRATLRGWIFGGGDDDAAGAMNLAIFVDADAVAGDATLLEDALSFVGTVLGDSDAYYARFARAADQFAEPTAPWWARLASLAGAAEAPASFDLKKLGIFPLVHGARALALQRRLRAQGTAARLAALAEAGALQAPFARDLTDALYALMALRLDHHLRRRAAGEVMDNVVRTAELGTLDRERLDDAFAIVRRFRQHLRLHFRLDAL